ncbi:MAG: hypothetical protein U0L92_00585 [Clostridia bacterium]|nr:hypothetical protein [Clostridia bacterium]
MRKARWIAAVLTVLMLIGMLGSYAVYGSSVDMLTQLGIVDESDGKIVTKGEFAQSLVRFMNMDIDYKGFTVFEDLNPEDEYYSAITLLADGGVLLGDGNGNIDADLPLTYNQAVKMLLCVMGYNDYAQQMGGYPTGYLRTAHRIGLIPTNRSQGETWLEENEAETMLIQALETPILSILSIDSNGMVAYTNTNGETLVSAYLHLSYGEGIVNAAFGVDGTTMADLSNDEICIGGRTYSFDGSNKDLVGYSVEFCYDEDNNIVALVKSDQNKSENIAFENLISTDLTREIRYTNDKSKVKSIVLRADMELIYNNAPLRNMSDIDLTDKDGVITAIDNDGDGDYDYILIDACEDFLVGSVDTVSGKVYEANDRTNVIELKKTGWTVVVVDPFGTEMAIDEILEGQLYTVYRNSTDKRLTMYYCWDEVSGKVETVYQNSRKELIIEGTSYLTTPYFDREYSNVEAGYEGVFLLNRFGKIAAYLPRGASDMKFGYVTAGCDKTVFETTYLLRIFTENGTFEELPLASKNVTFNNTLTTSANAYAGLLNDGSVTPQLIRYKVNRLGSITTLETAQAADWVNPNPEQPQLEHMIKYTGSRYYTGGRYISSSKLWDGKIQLSADTKLFVVPERGTAAEDSDYRVMNAVGELQSNADHNMAAYRVDGTSHTADVLVKFYKFENTSISNSSTIGVYDETIVSLGEDGEFVTSLMVYVSGGTLTEKVLRNADALNNLKDKDGNPHTLKRGDVIQMTPSIEGTILNVRMLYDYSAEPDKQVVQDSTANYGSDSSPSNVAYTYKKWYEGSHWRFAYVYEVDGSNLWVSSTEPTGKLTLHATEADSLHAYIASPVLVYDSVNDEFYSGGSGDISDYVHTGKADRVMILAPSGVTKLVYVVKK